MYTKPFVLAALANFLFYSNLNAYTLLPLYIHALGGREGQIGSIMALYSVAAILCQAGISPFLDRWNRKLVILLAAGTMMMASTSFALTSRLGWHFYLLRFIQGAAMALFLISNQTLIADLAPPNRRAEALGIFGVSSIVTIALGPALGEIVLKAWGFRTFLVVTVLVAMGALAVCLATAMPAMGTPETSRRLGFGFWRTFSPILTAALQFGLASSIVFVFLPPFAGAVWASLGLGRFIFCTRARPSPCGFSAAGWPIVWEDSRSSSLPSWAWPQGSSCSAFFIRPGFCW